ncbi:type II toxin-antitoxin system VapC family toxin [Propioniciclava soli]|uniref:type II toxin-antitoxin system VapC family toxin n=1 Tax=Propioniciclava soli TaxID=2775081 RepID=UPI001E5A2607|nr:type II toxin-antitoxin system VapC family toxin [Propioniciclava soli]
MIVDSSALVAILKAESDAPSIARALQESSHTWISAGALIETGIVVGRTRQDDIDELLRAASVEAVALDARQAAAAREAWYRYGRGTGFAYAAAKLAGEPDVSGTSTGSARRTSAGLRPAQVEARGTACA